MADNKKTGSATTETIIGKAAAKIGTGVAALKDAANVINELVEKSSDLAIDVASKEARITELDVEYGEKKRVAEQNLKLQVIADKAKVAEEYATDQNKVIVDKHVQERQAKELEDLNREFTTKVAAGVSAATSAMRKEHENELALQAANFATKEATNTATISSQTAVIEQLKQQITQLNASIDAERNASIERAKAQGSSVVNVTGQGR